MNSGKIKREQNPKEEANIFSNLFFLWTRKIFHRGLRNPPMSSDDLCKPLNEDQSDKLGNILEDKWMKEVEKAKKEKRNPKLLHAILNAFGWEYLKLAVIHLINELFRLTKPLLLGRLLVYFTNRPDMTKEEAFLYAGGMVVLMFLGAIMQNHYGLQSFHYGMKIRVACCSLIYRKTLKLSKTALGESAAGQAINLLSNDVSRFDLVMLFLHFLWSAPLGSLLIMYYMWAEAGIAGIVGVLAVLMIVPLQAYTGKLASRYRLQMAYKTDGRVRLMDQIISGIQVIKMYAWEKPFAKLISAERVEELKILRKSSYVRGLYMTFNLFTTRFALFCTMVTLSLFGESLSAEKVFVYFSYLNMMSFTMSSMYTRGYAEAAECLVALGRLTKYMLYEENTNKTEVSKSLKEHEREDIKKGEIVLKNTKAKWDQSQGQSELTLNNISVCIKQNTLTAIVGSVGSGKSSLLQALLGELPISEGKMCITGTVSYAGQEPWVFAASVRQNIIFGLPFNKTRYAEVIRVCALNDDFAQWPDGDRTIIGERGMTLSGGQRARINLARAIYKEADIYLLDDPLSAVDNNVGKHLFEECICSYLKDKTRILVTHQIQYLEKADFIVLLNNGSVQLQGNYDKLSNSNLDFAQLLKKDGEDEEENSGEIEKLTEISPVDKNANQTSNHSNRNSPAVDAISESTENVALTQLEEVKHTESPFLRYFLAGANFCVLLLLLGSFIASQASASLCDYWVSVWTTQDLLMRNHRANLVNFTTHFYNETGRNASETQIKSIDFMSTETCQLIHTGLIISLFLITITRSLLFFNVCMKSSQKLHDTMFKAVSETYMLFFNQNPSGRILNRFSKDLGSIDEMLPKAMLDATQIIMVIIGVVGVTIVVNYIFIFPVLLIGALSMLARFVFLKTSTNLKKIEGITRSPVFTHLNATLQGLTTIRAYRAEDTLKDEFDKHQDLHTSAWYLFIAASTGFGFTLDILSFLLMATVTFLFLLVETNLFGGQVGLAITQIMTLSGMVQWGMRQSAEVSNHLTSVERVLEYTELKQEKNLESGSLEEKKENQKRLESWPEKGKIEFQNMCLYYKLNDPPALKNLNLVVYPGEKIGIVGRTGAGKTSIISALFRLAKIEGAIRIDGIDTSEISLKRLRSRISIIPQEPMLFSGTIRKNLDPFKTYSDVKLFQAIEDVELKDALTNGLDTQVMDGGSNFSVGQKQLLCLARALIRNNKILLLDEATANVDPQTDALIQNTIRNNFSDCTVFTIAHRLNTVMDSDRIIVMDDGKIVEFDNPYNLLQKPEGHFAKLANQAGITLDQVRKDQLP